MAYDLIKISALPAATPDESQEIVVGVGDYAKRINYGDVKANMVGTSPSYTTDTEPYLMRRTAHVGVVGKCALSKLVGGSLGWNQLAKELNSANWINENGTTVSFTEGVATFTSTINNNGIVIQYNLSTFANHKYFLCADVKSSTAYTGLSLGIPGSGQPMIRHTDSIGGDNAWHTIEGIRECTSSDNLKRIYVFRTNGTVENLSVRSVMCLDLTAMFGSTIADYVYSLEQSSSGSGIAWLSKYIDLGTYHAYDAGSIQSVQATAHVTTGFNAWDEQWELGGISGEDGNNLSANDRIRSKDYIPIIGGTSYYFGHIGHTGATFYVCFYDGDKAFVPPRVTYTANTAQTIPSNVRYMRFFLYDAIHSVTTYLQDITINISKTTGAPKNGDYVPYSGRTYPLGSDTLRGIPQLVSNKLAFDGDEKYPDGTIRRKYGIVDLGSLTYTGDSGGFVLSASIGAKVQTTQAVMAKIICSKYPTIMQSQLSGSDKCVYGVNWGNGIGFRDSAYNTPAAFKTAMSGVYLVYELATETTESSTAYQKVQTIDADGTESFTTSTPVPVGHETQTPDNILAALGWLGE